MRKLVIFDAHGDDSCYFKRALKNAFGLKVETTKKSLNEETVKDYSEASLVSVFVTSKITSKVIDKLPDLEFIAARSTGYDHIDVAHGRKNHILTSTVPSYGDDTVAEYTFMLLLAVAKRLNESIEQVETGLINHPELTGSDLNGKTIGVAGTGKIGRQVAAIATGFGMKVLGYDIQPDKDNGIDYVSFDELLGESDILSLHLPLSDDTHHIIDSKALAKTKKGVILINTARGGLIDTKALIDCLYSGQVGGAGLDVVEGENLLRFEEEIELMHPDSVDRDLLFSAEHSILQRLSNVVMTPHNAFNSREALLRIRQTTVENIKQYLMHDPQNVIK